jgi:hypothetical protein
MEHSLCSSRLLLLNRLLVSEAAAAVASAIVDIELFVFCCCLSFEETMSIHFCSHLALVLIDIGFD